jgi:hypothetical protein
MGARYCLHLEPTWKEAQLDTLNLTISVRHAPCHELPNGEQISRTEPDDLLDQIKVTGFEFDGGPSQVDYGYEKASDNTPAPTSKMPT